MHPTMSDISNVRSQTWSERIFWMVIGRANTFFAMFSHPCTTFYTPNLAKAVEELTKTTLIPPTRSWPSWHLRIYKIEHTGKHTLRVLDVGFAISAETRAGVFVPDIDLKNISTLEPRRSKPGRISLGHVEAWRQRCGRLLSTFIIAI